MKQVQELGDQLEDQKASWAEYVNSNTNQVDEVYKQQAALKISSVTKQVSVRRMCASFYFWKSIITDKKYFADATAAGQNKTLYGELMKLRAKRAEATDAKEQAALMKQIATLEKMIKKDSTIGGDEEKEEMEKNLVASREREMKQEMEMEMIRDKLKKQACIQVTY